MVNEKITQAIDILKERNIDLWLTFVRESHTVTDPCLPLILNASCTWQSAFLISATGKKIAIVGNLDYAAIKDLGYYETISYKASIKDVLVSAIQSINPNSIAINYSASDFTADGLTHGMFLLLQSYLQETPFINRMVSSEDIISALRGRKSPAEIQRLKHAIRITLDIFDEVTRFVKPGLTEAQVAEFILNQVEKRGIEVSWDRATCPSVFSGPDTAGAHYSPTDRVIKSGHIMNIDFGVKIDDYVSDLQRTWYFLRPGETDAPAEVKKGFDTVRDAIARAAAFIKPGVEGWQVDDVARSYIVSRGFEEYPHALGHQVGRVAHDGAGVLCPRWERYGRLPYLKVEKGQVYTLEPRLTVPGYGVATIEEEIVVTEHGCEFLSSPQRELIVV
ncbi:MAG: M24 family metallopeptidase [Candidatus Zhuqueibacterota bacterium]